MTLDDDHWRLRDKRALGICATMASAPKITEDRVLVMVVKRDMARAKEGMASSFK